MPGTVAEFVESMGLAGQIESLVLGRVKARLTNLYLLLCTIVARRSELLGYGKDWSVQCQDNVTGWDIRIWF